MTPGAETEKRYLFDDRFAEAFFHMPQRRVMGMRLKPLSYWHKLQLEYFQSKVLLGGAALWDVWIAAKICRTEYPVHCQFPERLSKIYQIFWNCLYGWRNLAKELSLFSSHYLDYHAGPKLWSGSGSSKQRLSEAYMALHRATGDPDSLRAAQEWQARAEMGGKQRDVDDSIEQIAIYVKNGGTEDRAWNMPIGVLLWYNACFLKMNGTEVPIWTPVDEHFFEEHKHNRNKKIKDAAVKIMSERPCSMQFAVAQASVDYWLKVVQDQEDSGVS